MSTVKVTNVQHQDAAQPNIVLASDGTVSIPSLDGTVRSETVTTIESLTQAEYDNIAVPDPATLYVITD